MKQHKLRLKISNQGGITVRPTNPVSVFPYTMERSGLHSKRIGTILSVMQITLIPAPMM